MFGPSLEKSFCVILFGVLFVGVFGIVFLLTLFEQVFLMTYAGPSSVRHNEGKLEDFNSIAIFYLRIVQSRAQKVVIYTTVLCSTLFSIAMFFFAVFQCGIYDGAFDFIFRRLTNDCASDSSALGMTYTHAVITTLTDWTFLLMPVWLLRKSMMSKRVKLIVGLFLTFASISGIASIIRFPSIHTLAVPKIEFFGIAPQFLPYLS